MKYKISLLMAMASMMLFLSTTCYGGTSTAGSAGATITMDCSTMTATGIIEPVFNPSPQVWVSATSDSSGFSVHAVHDATLGEADKGGMEMGMASDSTGIYWHGSGDALTATSVADSSAVNNWNRVQ